MGNKMIRGRLTAANVMAGVALFLAMGGGAYAATGSTFVGAGGTIKGCVPKKGGTLKVVRVGKGCPKGTRSLVFAQTGATGAAGTTGATGAAGATGVTGPSNPSATTVDGETVTKLFLKEPTPATSMTITNLFVGDGLTITGDCDNGGNATVIANGPASADSELTVFGHSNSIASYGSQTSTLGPASFVSIGDANDGQATFSYASAAGQVVTGTIGWQSAPSLGSFGGCAFFGTAISG